MPNPFTGNKDELDDRQIKWWFTKKPRRCTVVDGCKEKPAVNKNGDGVTACATHLHAEVVRMREIYRRGIRKINRYGHKLEESYAFLDAYEGPVGALEKLQVDIDRVVPLEEPTQLSAVVEEEVNQPRRYIRRQASGGYRRGVIPNVMTPNRAVTVDVAGLRAVEEAEFRRNFEAFKAARKPEEQSDKLEADNKGDSVGGQ